MKVDVVENPHLSDRSRPARSRLVVFQGGKKRARLVEW